jgi:hypothetical protein
VPNKTIYVRDDDLPLFERAVQYAKRHRSTLSGVIAMALEEFLERHK